MMYDCDCGIPECPGCEMAPLSESEEWGLAYSGTPEAEGWEPIRGTGDQRDLTPEPPAYLSPKFILRNRERVKRFLKTGEFTWPRPV